MRLNYLKPYYIKARIILKINLEFQILDAISHLRREQNDSHWKLQRKFQDPHFDKGLRDITDIN